MYLFFKKEKRNPGNNIEYIRPKGGLPSSQDYAGYYHPVSE
jgi:hypothetical protein